MTPRRTRRRRCGRVPGVGLAGTVVAVCVLFIASTPAAVQASDGRRTPASGCHAITTKAMPGLPRSVRAAAVECPSTGVSGDFLASQLIVGPEGVWVSGGGRSSTRTGCHGVFRFDPVTVRRTAAVCTGSDHRPESVAADAQNLWVLDMRLTRVDNQDVDALTLLRVNRGTAAITGRYELAPLPFHSSDDKARIVTGRGAVWLLVQNLADLVRINPVDGTIQAKTRVAGQSLGLGFSAGRVWVMSADAAGNAAFTVVDPATNLATPTTASAGPTGYPNRLVGSSTSLWALQGGLIALDPREDRVVARNPRYPLALAVHGSKAWSGELYNPADLHDTVPDRILRFASGSATPEAGSLLPPSGPARVSAIAVDRHRVWALEVSTIADESPVTLIRMHRA